jgi:hypothetical protein
MRWAGHVARMWAKMNAYRERHWEDLDIGRRIILSRVLLTLDVGLDWRIDLLDIHKVELIITLRNYEQ